MVGVAKRYQEGFLGLWKPVMANAKRAHKLDDGRVSKKKYEALMECSEFWVLFCEFESMARDLRLTVDVEMSVGKLRRIGEMNRWVSTLDQKISEAWNMLSSNYSRLCAVVSREKEKGNPNRAAKNPMKYYFF